MNPLDELRGEVPYMDALTRARMAGERGDALEAAQADAKRQEAAERSYSAMAHQQAVERAQTYAQGYSARELEEHNRARDNERQEKIAYHEGELMKLDPNRRATAKRTQSDIDTEALLRRAREVGNSPFMRQQVAELERREQAHRDEVQRVKMARTEAELSRTGRY